MFFSFVLYFLIFLFLFIILIYLWSKFKINKTFPRNSKTNEYLLGPPKYFITGIDPFSHDPTKVHWRFKEYCEQYNDFFGFVMFNRPFVGVGDPEVLNELISNKEFTLRMYPPLFDKFFKNRGILFTNDMKHWKIHRTAASHGIMKTSHLKKIAQWANISVDRFIERLIKDYGNSNFEIEIDPQLSKLALDVIGRTIFSIDVNSVGRDDSEFEHLIVAVMNVTNKYNLLPPWVYDIYTPTGLKVGREALESLESIVQSLIDERRKGGDFTQHDDLLDFLLGSDHQISDEDIIITSLDMFVAGHETTAHAMAWTMYFLSHNPKIQDELYDEIIKELGNEEPTYASIQSLSFCHNIIKETLRLKPVVPFFSRISPKTQVLNGYTIQANTPVLIMNSRLHVHPKYWKNPLEYNPHRWDTIDNTSTIPYRPFGFGARVCVGSRMAIIEAKIVLSKLIRTYKIYPNNSKFDEVHQVTMAPKGLKVNLEKRT